MARPPLADLYVGQTLAGRFAIQDYLDSGNFSMVFHALDTTTGSEVAVKVLLPSASAEARVEFDTECELLSLAINAEYVIDRVDDGNDTISVQIPTTGAIVPLPTRYLVLERAEQSLSNLLAIRNRISWPDRLAIYRGAVKGVHQLHLHRIAHRDTKADNILLVIRRGKVIAKVADLGRSRLTTKAARFTADDYRVGRGDLRFAPPEFLFHLGTDEAATWQYADLYYLGSLLFEIATGQGITTASLGDIRRISGPPPV
jgi:serine/threonine protein kinase